MAETAVQGEQKMKDRMLCVSKECPNKERCSLSLFTRGIDPFPAVYTAADLTTTCLWYKSTMAQEKQESEK